MEMGMRADAEIGIGQDLTPPLLPLTSALHHSSLHSHCFSCFSPLHVPSLSPSPLFCSSFCSSSSSPFSALDSALLLHPYSSDLRAALRLLPSLPTRQHSRIFGLLTNLDKLMVDDEMSSRVRDGARAMAAAWQSEFAKSCSENDTVIFEAALCVVITNAVEVHDKEGRALGIAVYGPNFSWINHSCSPNACYRFQISPPHEPPLFPPDSGLRIVPTVGNEAGAVLSNIEVTKEWGPRVIVRSIKRLNKGEEVMVAYTDLLLPKEIRRSELWSKYRFLCCCTRCSASPALYVDHALQEISASNLALSSFSSCPSFDGDEATRKLTDYVDDIITGYLTVGDPESCCRKLESVLFLNQLEQLDTNKSQLYLGLKLNPLHHLSLNAYMILASAYKIRASDALDLELDSYQLDSFEMSRAGSAYSLLLAGATYHLFCFESSLIACVANFWTSAGESLLTLTRSSAWDSFGKWESRVSSSFSLDKLKCSKCSLSGRIGVNMCYSQGKSVDLERASSEFLDCITESSQNVWRFLIQGHHHLELFKDPIDLSWLGRLSVTDGVDSNRWIKRSSSAYEANEYSDLRVNIFHLGVHCLLYSATLANICYGSDSHLPSHITSILNYEDK